jgi:hypothetical protein
MPVANAEADGPSRLVWRLTSNSDKPPVIVFDFDGPAPPPAVGLVIVGRCLGRTDDGLRRELPNYGFTVRIAECRVAPALQSRPPRRKAPLSKSA